MGRRRDARAKIERGDFQTPPALAADVCRVLAAHGLAPRSIVEPTCGTGGLLAAALDAFPAFDHALGVDINAEHVTAARGALAGRADADRIELDAGCFFDAEWPRRLARLPDPILVIGNPPWVTNSDLGALASDNLPHKANSAGRSGLDALTGKSNFDISEWMLRQLITGLAGRDATLAMLCKTSVARKVIAFAWQSGVRLRAAAIARIDAAQHFDAAVEACLLVAELGDGPGAADPTCRVVDRLPDTGGLADAAPSAILGYRGGRLIADVALYDRWQGLEGESPYQWRSGIKHDCAAVMELVRTPTGFQNRAGEPLDPDPGPGPDAARDTAPDTTTDAAPADRWDRWLYPLWKSSEVAHGRPREPQRYLLVTQTRTGDDTRALEASAPAIWRYLTRHRARFDRRASAIYRGKPPFAIFGVGDYTFAPWKVAISGLYKQLAFCVVGPHAGKPVVFDDTCYFLACASEAEARLIAALLASPPAQALYGSQVFWDAKRPITTELLRRLDLRKLAHQLGRDAELSAISARA